LEGEYGLSSVTLTLAANDIAVNPVEPYVYAALGNSIDVFDVHSGALLREIGGTVANLGHIAVSDDGTRLFAIDLANSELVVLDASTGSELARRPFQQQGTLNSDSRAIFARVDGRELLLSDTTFDLESNQTFWEPLVDTTLRQRMALSSFTSATLGT